MLECAGCTGSAVHQHQRRELTSPHSSFPQSSQPRFPSPLFLSSVSLTRPADDFAYDLNTATLAKELDSDAEDGDLPDQLPPTFYVNDRYDDN
eukprot:2645277-Rhodomonas_salina.1